MAAQTPPPRRPRVPPRGGGPFPPPQIAGEAGGASGCTLRGGAGSYPGAPAESAPGRICFVYASQSWSAIMVLTLCVQNKDSTLKLPDSDPRRTQRTGPRHKSKLNTSGQTRDAKKVKHPQDALPQGESTTKSKRSEDEAWSRRVPILPGREFRGLCKPLSPRGTAEELAGTRSRARRRALERTPSPRATK